VPVTSLSRHVTEIRRTQDGVLAGLDPRDFRPTHRWAAISALAGEVTEGGLARLLADPDVDQVDLDVSGTAGAAESVPMIRADDVHDLGFTGRGVLVAVLDTGIDTDHPDLKNSLADQQCFCAAASGAGCCPNGTAKQSGAGAAEDDHGHGTNVTGIAVAAGAKRHGARRGIVVSRSRRGGFSSTAQVSRFDYLLTTRPDAKVVNMSPAHRSSKRATAPAFATALAQASMP
jgi:subtilisin family serine protease